MIVSTYLRCPFQLEWHPNLSTTWHRLGDEARYRLNHNNTTYRTSRSAIIIHFIIFTIITIIIVIVENGAAEKDRKVPLKSYSKWSKLVPYMMSIEFFSTSSQHVWWSLPTLKFAHCWGFFCRVHKTHQSTTSTLAGG